MPVRNGAATIEPCLQALLDVLPPSRSEIIVVDNGSTDETLAIVGRFPVQGRRLGARYVSSSRNVGAVAGQYDLLAFIDADCVMQAGWVEAALLVLNDDGAAICGARYQIRENAGWVERAWDEAHRDRSQLVHDVEYVPGGNLALRWTTFERLGGYDEAIETGEDMDLCIRAAKSAGRVVCVPEMRMVHLGEPRTFRAVVRRHAWHGRGAELFYSNGRVCFVTISTVAFAASLLASAAGLVAVFAGRPSPAAAAIPAAALVPGVYAARYARGGWSHALRLWLVYLAYFLGRTRGMVSARLRP